MIPDYQASSSVAVSSAFEHVLHRHSTCWSSVVAALHPMTEIITGAATSSAIHIPRQSSSPAAASSSTTLHARLVAGGRVLRCPCPTPELVAEAASSAVHTPHHRVFASARS
ncbi:Os07g0234100 [Oryza sativa Japonica Group]|uniref:Os07g0234100 protein n=1 Tax=Oryza sativa subsp. japonica TaxID=39947 RepID=A0A0P0X482_ORYSJ|nr:Os07g0234100 [Oryza sativa Japonica Group]